MAATGRILTGVRELDRALDALKQGVANRVARSALTKGARIGAKRFKALIPARYKSVRRVIAGRGKRDKVNKTWTAKFGAGVGKAKASRGGTSGGVGIGSRNVHWWILGTSERPHPRTGTSGAMPPVGAGLLQAATSSSRGEIAATIKKAVREGIEREARKARAKGKTIFG